MLTNFIKNLVPSCLHALLSCKRHAFAFTMAEILLSLTIIGVVAAITLPALTGNINEKTWDTQRKALYARMSQAIALMGSLNGYGQYVAEVKDNNYSITTSGVDTAAETFVTEGLAKVLKINNICDNQHFKDCGMVSSLTNMAGSAMNMPKTLGEMNSYFLITANPQKNIDTVAVAFETQNGETITVFYNPYCQSDLKETTLYYIQPKMCANFIYDLNGLKGPNTVGKDIGFITAIYPTDTIVVAPIPILSSVSSRAKIWSEAKSYCNLTDIPSRMPNKEELQSIFYNIQLLDSFTNAWSASTVLGAKDKAWSIKFRQGGKIEVDGKNNTARNTLCIKK